MVDTLESLRSLLGDDVPAGNDQDGLGQGTITLERSDQDSRDLLEQFESPQLPRFDGPSIRRPTRSEQHRSIFTDIFARATELFTPRGTDPVQRRVDIEEAVAIPEGADVGKTVFDALAKGGANLAAVIPKLMGISSAKLAQLMGVPDADARKMITFKIGELITQAAKEQFPGDPKLQKNFILNVAPQNIDNAVVFMGILFATRDPNKSRQLLNLFGQASVVALGGGLEGVGEFEAALEEGKSPETAGNIALLNVPLGLLDKMPVDMALKSILKGNRIFKESIRTFAADALTEGAQKIGSNIIADRPNIVEGVGQEVLGTIFGPGGVQVSVAGVAAMADRHRTDEPTSVLEEDTSELDTKRTQPPKDAFDSLPDAAIIEDEDTEQATPEDEVEQNTRGDTADVLQDEINEEADVAAETEGDINTQKAGQVQTEITFSEIADSLPEGLDRNSSVEDMRTAAADAGADGRHADRYQIGVAAMEQNGEIVGDIVTLDAGLLEDGDTFTIGSLIGRVKRRDGDNIVIELSDGRETDTFNLNIGDDIFANANSFIRKRPSIINKLRRFIRKGIRDRRRERSQDRKQFREDMRELKRLHREDTLRLKKAGRDKARVRRLLVQAMLRRVRKAVHRAIEKKDQGKFLIDMEQLAGKANPTEEQLQKVLSKITALHEDTVKENARNEAQSLFNKMAKAKTLIGPFRKALEKLGDPNFKTMTLDEANVIYDRLQRIRAGNNLARKTISRGKKVDRAKFEAQAVGELRSKGLVVDLVPFETDGNGRVLADDQDVALLAKFKNVMVGVMENIGLDVLLEQVAGVGSTIHRIAYDEIRSGISRARAGTQQAADFADQQLRRAGFDPDTPEMWSLSAAYSGTVNLIESLVNPEQRRGQTKAEVRTFTTTEGESRNYTPAELMDLYNAIKDDGFLLRLLSGARYRPSSHAADSGIVLTETDLIELRDGDILSSKERQVADSLFDYVNNILGPKYGEWSEQQNGYDNRVAHMYWMIARDADATENLDTALSQLRERLMQQANVAKDRTGDLKSELIGGDIFLRFHNHAHIINQLTEVQPAIQQARQLVNTGPIKKILMSSPLGKRLHERLMKNYQQMAIDAIGGSVKHSAFANLIRNIIRNLASLLAYNPPVMLYQHASVFTAMDVIPGAFLSQAESDGAAFDTALDDEMHSDPDMRDRMETNASHILTEGATFQAPVLGGRPTAMQRGMAGIRAIDQTVMRVIWHASKLAGENEGLSGEALRSFQAELTNKAVRRTQPTSNTIDASALAVEARQDTAAMAMNMFRSARSKIVSITLSRMLMMLAKKGSRADHALILVVGVLGPSVAVAVVRMLFNAPFKGDSADEDESDLAVEFASEVMSNVAGNFVGGDYAATLVRHAIGTRSFNPSNPIDSILDKGLYSLGDLMQQNDDEDMSDNVVAAMRLAETISALTGRPYVWPIGFTRKAYQKATEKTTSNDDFEREFR